MPRILIVTAIVLFLLTPLVTASVFLRNAQASESPALVGWGNLLIPGFGASLQGDPGRGLLEASLELGTFFGGAAGVPQGRFTIDGTIPDPTSGNFYRPVAGQMLQQFGLKLHMYDTFYHYQQSALSLAGSDREKDNGQPLYQGTWKDVLSAPFRWENIANPWVYPVLLASTIFLMVDYSQSPVQAISGRAPAGAETLYGAHQLAVIPLGSAYGEETLFRGFIQREMRLYSGSAGVSIAFQSTLAAMIHPPELRALAFLGGIYYGIMVDQQGGNLEPAIASHFWTDVLDGVITYWTFRRMQYKDTPFMPPVAAQLSIPF